MRLLIALLLLLLAVVFAQSPVRGDGTWVPHSFLAVVVYLLLALLVHLNTLWHQLILSTLWFNSGGDAEQEVPPPPPKCKLSTLTWYARASQMSDWEVNYMGFTLTINDTYQWRIPMHYPKVGRLLRSPDLKFAVKYGDIANNHDVMLKWEMQLFTFTKINDLRTNLTEMKYRYEYDYWACIVP